MERRSQSPLHTVLRSMMGCQTAQSSVPAQSGCSCMVLGNAACEKSLEGSRGLKSSLLIFASGQILFFGRTAGMQIALRAFV